MRARGLGIVVAVVALLMAAGCAYAVYDALRALDEHLNRPWPVWDGREGAWTLGPSH